MATYVILPGQCLLRGLLSNETGWARHLSGIHSHVFFVSVLQGSWRKAILFYVQLVCHSVEDRLLPVAGSTVSTVGMDPLFRRLRGVLSAASGPKGSFRLKQAGCKWAEQRAEYLDGANFARIESTASLNFYLQGSDAWICQGYSWCSCS